MAAGPHVLVGPDSIDLSSLIARVHSRAAGAVVAFVGTVRDRNDGRDVVAVSYDAAIPLATATLTQIADEALRASSDRLALAVVHRTGRLLVGETSVAIVVASPHRAEAYVASRYVIEQIKRRVPVWKQEHYTDGDSEWLEGCCLHDHDASVHA